MAATRLKGWMIDAARLPEPLAYYRRVIDFCASWGFNAILFRLTDDQGSAFRFESHPELVTHAHAYTPAELRELVAYAAGRGIELIPEIESFGHTSYITDCPAYAELLDADPAGTATFTGLIPVHAGSLALMDDLYQEVAAVFPSRYLHGGCDEVNWGGSERSRQAVAEQGRAEVWAGYVNRLGRLAHDCGKEFIIWGDHGLRGDTAILDRLDKDIILMDWNYWDTEPARGRGESVRPGPVQWAADTALAKGFRLMGAPAWGWCRWGTRPGRAQLHNIDAFADIYRGLDDPKNLGVVVTNWVPSRWLQGAIWDGIAYAAVALNEGSPAAHGAAFARFVAQHYGARWDETWADIFNTLYDMVPPRARCSGEWLAPFQPIVWRDEAELLSAKSADTPRLPFARLRAQIAVCEAQVRDHREDFEAFALTVEYLEHIHRRQAAVPEAAAEPERAAAIMQEIAGRDRQMLDALNAEWERGRFADAPARSRRLATLSLEDQTLLDLQEAAAFSAALAAAPARLGALLEQTN